MKPLNINNTEDESTTHKFLDDETLRSSVESFLNSISETNLITKQMVISLEELVKDNFISSNINLNEFSNYPSKLGIVETKNIITKALNNVNVPKPNNITVDDVSALASRIYTIVSEIISRVHLSNTLLDLNLVNDLRMGKYKVYNDNDVLVSLADIDLFDAIFYYDYELSDITNNIIVNNIRKYMSINDIKPEYLYVTILSHREYNGNYEEADVRTYLEEDIKRYTISEFITLIEEIDKTIATLTLVKSLVQYILSPNYPYYGDVNRLHTMLSKIYDKINDTDLLFQLLQIFNKQN